MTSAYRLQKSIIKRLDTDTQPVDPSLTEREQGLAVCCIGVGFHGNLRPGNKPIPVQSFSNEGNKGFSSQNRWRSAANVQRVEGLITAPGVFSHDDQLPEKSFNIGINILSHQGIGIKGAVTAFTEAKGDVNIEAGAGGTHCFKRFRHSCLISSMRPWSAKLKGFSWWPMIR